MAVHNKNEIIIEKISPKAAGVLRAAVLMACAWLSVQVVADGLPGEYLLSDQWRALFGYYSPLNNPAFLMEQQHTQMRGVMSVSPDDVAQLWELGVVRPLGLYHTVGITMLGENGRKIDDGLLNAEGAWVPTGSGLQNNNYHGMISYALNPWGRLCLGLNVSGAYQTNFGEPSTGFGADLGLSYRLLLHPVFGFHLVGVTYQNLLSPRLNAYDDMPNASQAKFFYHTAMLQNRFDIDCQVDISDISASPETFLAGEKILEWDLSWQAGFRMLPFLGIKAFAAYGDSRELEFWGAALSINVPHLNGGRDFEFTYQYRDEMNSDLMGSHSVYFRGDFGAHREEIHSKKIARLVSLSANELYNRAMKLYYKEKYWDAYFLFERILAEFPDFFKNDLVNVHAASCLEELDMREESVRLYENTKRAYPMSAVVPLADLGLMRIYYRQGQYSAVNNQYVELNRPGVPDSVRAHAAYIMGESELRQTNYRSALQNFELVSEGHPAYPYAQHSSGTAHALANSGMHMVVASFENCLSAKAETPADKELMNRSYVLLGYIFYEENTLSKAVTALRAVDPTSRFYEDALLGLGWTAIKARQWPDCIAAGQQLAAASDKPVLQAEGALIEAYGHMLQKRYDQAHFVLQPAIQKMRAYSGISADSLSTEKMRYESDRISYGFLAEKVSSIAQRGQSALSKQSEIDSLHAEQIRMKEKIDRYLKFTFTYDRVTFFGRNAQAVNQDIEYAVATIQKILKTGDVTKVREKMISKDKAISSEIDRLKEQMEQIETPTQE